NITRTQSKATPNESSSQGTNSGGGPRSKQERIEAIDADEDITLVNDQDDADKDMFDVNVLGALEALKTSKCKVKGLVIQEPSKSTTTTTTISSEQSHDKGKGIMIEEPVNLSRKIKLGLMKKLLKENEKRSREELIQESKKKQKVEDDKEKAELKKLIKTIPNEEEVAIDAIPLAVKSPWIVDWKIHKEGKKSYYQLMRANGKSQMYMFFSQMLKSFDREDLEDLYNLIYMLVEKKYPLTSPALSMMLEKKLQIEYESEMAYQLCKLIKKQLKK
nr:hypothetical protein [Tanacetum cinerariifolium]